MDHDAVRSNVSGGRSRAEPTPSFVDKKVETGVAHGKRTETCTSRNPIQMIPHTHQWSGSSASRKLRCSRAVAPRTPSAAPPPQTAGFPRLPHMGADASRSGRPALTYIHVTPPLSFIFSNHRPSRLSPDEPATSSRALRRKARVASGDGSGLKSEGGDDDTWAMSRPVRTCEPCSSIHKDDPMHHPLRVSLAFSARAYINALAVLAVVCTPESLEL
jgi:hypothetical protein